MSGAELPVTASVPDQPSAERVDTNTWQMWAIAALPLAGLPLDLVPGARAPMVGVDVAASPVLLLNLLVSLALVTIEVLLAVSDRRELVRRGVPRPMHPAWAILDVVYVVGRSVVVRRRVGGSLLPLWAWVATTAIAYAVGSIPS